MENTDKKKKKRKLATKKVLSKNSNHVFFHKILWLKACMSQFILYTILVDKNVKKKEEIMNMI